MPKNRDSRADVILDVSAAQGEADAVPDPDIPFRIAILGDFSGRANRGLSRTLMRSGYRSWEIDSETFDSVLAKASPCLRVPLSSGESASFDLSFRDLDDFHPDRLFGRLELFGRLRNLRQRIADPDSFPLVAAELGLHALPATVVQPEIPAAGRQTVQPASGSLLDEIVAGAEGPRAAPRSPSIPGDLGRIVQRIVSPHVISGPDPRQPELLRRVDRMIADLLWAILHHPDFQALESIWRGLYFLLRRIETGPSLKVEIFDVSKDELASDLASAADIRSTTVYDVLVRQTTETPGGEPWALVLGVYTFDDSRGDIELLARAGQLARMAGAPFLAAADPSLIGLSSPETADSDRYASPEWHTLRRSADARYIGLVLPRFLLRLPYGKETDRTEAFDFEEITGPPRQEDYLWGNPAFACGYLLAQGFSDSGWSMRPGAHADVKGLPLHGYVQNGEHRLTPCAEILLAEEAIERILDFGVMPLASIKSRDEARLVRFQSIADPPSVIAGRWDKTSAR